jgi:hypothetical protein
MYSYIDGCSERLPTLTSEVDAGQTLIVAAHMIFRRVLIHPQTPRVIHWPGTTLVKYRPPLHRGTSHPRSSAHSVAVGEIWFCLIPAIRQTHMHIDDAIEVDRPLFNAILNEALSGKTQKMKQDVELNCPKRNR